MSDFLFYISLDRVHPEKTPRDVGHRCNFAKQQNCSVRPSSESPSAPLHDTLSARSRTATEKSSSSCLHHLGALFQPQIRSRGRGEVFEVSHPSLSPLASLTSSFSCFAAKHSGRKLFINVKTAEPLPFTRSCCDVKGIHSPQLSATRTFLRGISARDFRAVPPAVWRTWLVVSPTIIYEREKRDKKKRKSAAPETVIAAEYWNCPEQFVRLPLHTVLEFILNASTA